MARILVGTEGPLGMARGVGGKNASLGEMTNRRGAAGIRVPPGFATTPEPYERDPGEHRPRRDGAVAPWAGRSRWGPFGSVGQPGWMLRPVTPQADDGVTESDRSRTRSPARPHRLGSLATALGPANEE
ncbi:PEP/pyruvate-binding domain-containing protein [Streptomyces sp. NPDC096351]|uniref:PEP/pyruvate-binding domain-containing protein n=1 Tax=Streptomyces sp. NPDC096351 TaxID=3366087 RepID=UPI003812353A